MKTKLITPLQYAKSKKCTVQNISKKLRGGSELKDVIKIHSYSRFYLLEVPKNYNIIQ